MWEKASAIRSFWIEKPWLLAGAYPFSVNEEKGIQRLNSLFKDGVCCFINLTEEGEVNYNGIALIDYSSFARRTSMNLNHPLTFLRYGFRDGGIPTPKLMKAILTKLFDNKRKGIVTYIHCWGGRGRTATVLGCWFVESRGITGKEILNLFNRNLNFSGEGPWTYKRYGGPYVERETQKRFILEWKDLRKERYLNNGKSIQ